MIGWFSLSVPSGLGLYWLTNNVVTTVTTLGIRASVSTDDMVLSSATTAVAVEPKPAGFGRKFGEIIESTDGAGTTTTIRPPGATKKERRAAAAAAPDGSVPAAAVVDVAAGAAAVDGDVPEDSSKSAKKKKARAKKGGKRKL